MKKHLVNLLLEEYKQQCLFDELEKKGIVLATICVNNLSIVFDIIGFPSDNSIDSENQEDVFCRDWLTDKYFETFRTLATQQKVCVTDNGLQIESGADQETVIQQLNAYVDWLYVEFNDLDK
jgi:hypothetical protein